MQRLDSNGYTVIDIEDYFPGLLYMKAEGMNDIGKAKNVYLEGYADSDRMRYYLPNDKEYANEATTIVMHFLVVGDSATRERIIGDFFDYVRKGVHRYWDDARNLEFDFIVTEKLKVSDERWHGSQPYVEIEVPMQNLYGKTSKHSSGKPSGVPSVSYYKKQQQQESQASVSR